MSALEQLKDSLWVIYAMVRGILATYTPIPDIHYDDETSVTVEEVAQGG